MKKATDLLLLVILLANGLTACGETRKQHVIEATRVAMDATVVIPTPPACAPLPAGKSLSVEPISASAVRVSGEGFRPGKRFIVVLNSEVPRDQRKCIQWRQMGPVAADGSFTSTLDGLDPIYGAITNTWEVMIIYDDAAACRTVVLPSEK